VTSLTIYAVSSGARGAREFVGGFVSGCAWARKLSSSGRETENVGDVLVDRTRACRNQVRFESARSSRDREM
jgi:hypothetical protein